ncbi:MAG: D-2-hydroxyacid dehydrogenase [Rhodospirillales bacterium]|nr:D-2-hydroxyacid dehydrogenase [Rhodospirillales bacterium]
MHIHLQNTPGDPLFAFSRQMWEEAASRAPDIGAGHHVTIGDTEADLQAALRTAEALVCDAGIIRTHFAEARTRPDAPRLTLLFATNAGLDRLAPFGWLPDGMILMNNRGTHDAKSGEFAIMAVLMLVNRIPEMVTNQRAGQWQKIWGTVLSRHRLTVVGLGTLGGATARNAAGFGMRVTGVRVHPRPHPHCSRVVGTDDLDTVLPETDVLVLACPLTDATRGLMDRRRLSLLPQGAGLVNIARGEVVDQDAVCDMLDDGRLGGAVLDVFTPEPSPAGHRLWTTPSLIISPHTSADDPATYNPHSLDIFLENLRAWRDGQPMPNRFDVARGY